MTTGNLYEGYIELLKEKAKKGFAPGVVLHKHHIHPKHSGGDPNGELIECTIRDHARAHYIRYKVYGEMYDYSAYCGLVNRPDEMHKAIIQQIVETNRLRKNGMFNREWQKEMANRPKSSYHFQQNPDFARSLASNAGKIGGKTMTDKKRKTLKQNGSNVGTNYGYLGGIQHQHPKTRERLSKYIEWEHTSGGMTISPPFESVEKLKNYLNIFVPGSIRQTNCFSELLRGVAKSRYGWTIKQEFDFYND